MTCSLMLIFSAFAGAGAAEAVDHSKEEFFAAQRDSRDSDIAAIEEQIKAIKSDTSLQTARRVARIAELNKKVKALRALKPSIPELNWPPKIGDVGELSHYWKVEAVQGAREVVVYFTRQKHIGLITHPETVPERKNALLVGVDTSGMVDDETIAFPAVVEVLSPRNSQFGQLITLAPYTRKKAAIKRSEIAKDIPQAPPSVPDGRHEWINQSYPVVLRQGAQNEWTEFDKTTGKPTLHYREVLRTNETIELYCEERKQELRVLAKRMEMKKNGRWEWVANGAWTRQP